MKRRIGYLYLFMCLLIFWQCGTMKKCPQTQKGEITVIGKAKDAKAGAIIITDQDSVYYVGGLRRWQDKYLDKKIKVKGKLVVENCGNEMDSTRWTQTIIGDKYIIKKAEIELTGD